MGKRRVISYAPIGLTRLYLEKIEKDLADEIRLDRENIQPIGTTSIFNRMIAEYFYMKYGQDERARLRNIFYEEVINKIEKGTNDIEIKYVGRKD